MFSVKQETSSGSKLWPAVSHVYTGCINLPFSTDRVTVLFDGGGLMDFDASAGLHVIYVMNENGSTVARYDIGNRANVSASGGLPAA